MLTKLAMYVERAKVISGSMQMSFPVVLTKAVVANVFFGHGIKYFSLYSLAKEPVARFGGYMTKKQLEPIQRQLNSADGKAIADSKLAFYRKCVEYDLPTPEIYALLTKGDARAFGGLVPVVSNAAEFQKIVAAQGGDRSFVLKPEEGYHGKGVRRFRWVGNRVAYSKDGVEHVEDPQTYLDSLFAEAEVYLLQEALQPHEELRSLMPGAGMGTVRAVTVNHAQGPKVAFVCARIPLGDNVSDNFVGGQSGNLVASLDLATGALGTVYAPGAVHPAVLTSIERHPLTGLEFEGYCYPRWDEILKIALTAAAKFDCLYTAGWDIALSTRGPVLIETNWRYDIDILQFAGQRPLKDEMLSALGVGGAAAAP